MTQADRAPARGRSLDATPSGRPSGHPQQQTHDCPTCLWLDALAGQAGPGPDYSKLTDLRVLRARHAPECVGPA